MLIEIEGIDGAGKTTIVTYVERELKRKGFNVISFKEPSNSIYSKKLKNMSQHRRLSPQDESDLLIKDREIDVRKNIIPALREGKIVIMDRYYYSHVYQAARGMSLDEIINENRKFAPEPDVVIVLDVPAEVALKRIKKSRESTDSFENKEYLEKVRELYLKLKNLQNVYIVDANKEINEVRKEVMSIILRYLEVKDE